jgi:hypothetical protein
VSGGEAADPFCASGKPMFRFTLRCLLPRCELPSLVATMGRKSIRNDKPDAIGGAE